MTLPPHLQEHVDRLTELSLSIHNSGLFIAGFAGFLVVILGGFVYIHISECIKEHHDDMEAEREIAKIEAKARKARRKAEKKRKAKAAVKKVLKSALKKTKDESKESKDKSSASASASASTSASASASKNPSDATKSPHVKFTGEAQPIDSYTVKNFRQVETKWLTPVVSDSHIPGTDSFGTSVPTVSDTMSDHSKMESPTQTATPVLQQIGGPAEVSVPPKT